jgi:hypothetical protein
MILLVFPLAHIFVLLLGTLPRPEPVPARLAEIHSHLKPSPHLVSHRLATVVLFSPILLLSLTLGLLSGLEARKRLTSNFEFSSPTMFLVARKTIFVSLSVPWIYIFLPIQIPAQCLLASAGLSYVGVRLAAKHFPSVW